jgi:hypothetical protein
VRRGSQGSAEEGDFEAIMRFIESPQGCRQAQVAGTFEGRSPGSNTNLMLLCQGGCDVCDMRVRALRDMRAEAQRALGALEGEPGGRLAHRSLIERLMVRSTAVLCIQSAWNFALRIPSENGLPHGPRLC